MKNVTEALRLATWLDHVDLAPMDYEDAEKAAGELRRLHAVNAELLEALQAMLRMTERHATPGLIAAPGSPVALARAAIARAEGEQA